MKQKAKEQNGISDDCLQKEFLDVNLEGNDSERMYIEALWYKMTGNEFCSQTNLNLLAVTLDKSTRFFVS